MCGRTRVSLAPEQVLRAAGAARWVDREAYQPSYNVSPGSATPVVVAGADGVQVQTMRWGLVPSFTKKDERPDFWRMFNARSESVAEKPAFRRLVPSRRCLVLVDAFYEWQKQKDGTKQPYHIYLAPAKSKAPGSGSGSGSQEGQQGQPQQGQEEQAAAADEEPLVFAGLYDVWDGPEGPMHTYTILTTDASKRLEWLHDRMPVILRTKEAQQAWLSTGDKAATGLQKLFTPYNGEDLRWYPVTQQMNKPAFQGPECCKEVKKPSIQSFFQPRRASVAGSKAAAADKSSPAGAAAAAAAAAAEGKAVAGTAGEAAVKQEQAVSGPAAAAVKEEGSQETAADPAKEEQQEQQQQQAAEPAGSAATATEAVNADERPEAKPRPSQQQQQPQQQPAAGAATSPAGQKRKQPGSGGGTSGGKGKGSGSAAKKLKPGEKLPGQKDVRQFFLKQ